MSVRPTRFDDGGIVPVIPPRILVIVRGGEEIIPLNEVPPPPTD